VQQPSEAQRLRGRNADAGTDITFVTHGSIPAYARPQAERILGKLEAKAPRPIIFARFKLRVERGRPPDQQALAQATIDVSGSRIRAHVAGSNLAEALDLLEERLDRRLRRLSERRQDSSTRPPQAPPGEWRHGDLPTTRPGYYDRDPQDREIVRRKAYAPTAVSVEEALFDLDVLDHTFFLFTDEEDGEDSIVYERDGGVVLHRLSGGEPRSGRARQFAVSVHPTPVPGLSESEAVAHLDASEEPFLFFRDRTTDRGKVIYRRYDGHYGMIEPAG